MKIGLMKEMGDSGDPLFDLHPHTRKKYFPGSYAGETVNLRDLVKEFSTSFR
jgi:hypothetical protein